MSDTNHYYVEYHPFDCRTIDKYPESIVDTACEKAEMFLSSQEENLAEIDTKCVTIMGWLLTAISGLVGFVAVFLSEANEGSNYKLLIIALIGLLVFSIAAAILFKSNLYKRSTYGPGIGPDLLFNKDVCAWVDEHYPESERTKMIKGCYLNALQEKIIFNNKETHHRIQHYRACIWVIAIGLLVALLSSIALIFF